MKKVTVVILNWNGKALMEHFLPSVVSHTPSQWGEVVVADNGSTDDSVPFLQKHYPGIRVILLEQNYGFAEGYNRALAQVEAEYVVLLNSDVEVTAGWLDAPLACMDSDRQVAAVQPKLLAEQSRSSFEYSGAAGGFIDRYGYPFCRGRILSVVEQDKGQYDQPAQLLWASGACLIMRREIYQEAGGLDKNFFAHQEEIDLCWRLRSRGYQIVCLPQSVVYHVGGATLNAESPQKTFLNFRNNLLMLYKNLPERELYPVLRSRFFLDYLAALQFLLTGHFRNAWAVRQARHAFARMKQSYISIRQENLKKSKTDQIQEIYPGSLLMAFYLKGIRTFDQLYRRKS